MKKTPRIPNPESVGGRIRSRRHALRMTQEDLAALCFITPTELSGIERGSISPRVNLLLTIAQAMQTEAASFLPPSPLEGEGPGEGSSSSSGTGILPVSYPFSNPVGFGSAEDHATRPKIRLPKHKRQAVPA